LVNGEDGIPIYLYFIMLSIDLRIMMEIFMRNAFKALKARFAPDMNNPRERYVHTDGSPYGSRGLGRFFQNPAVKVTATVSVFEIAGRVITHSITTETGFIVIYSTILGVVGFMYVYDKSHDKKDLKARNLDNAVIDKTGRNVSDPHATLKLATRFKYDGKFGLIVAPVFTGAFFGLSHKFATPYLAYSLAKSLWRIHAARKLEKGKWTVQTKPPKLEERKTISVFSKLAVAPTP